MTNTILSINELLLVIMTMEALLLALYFRFMPTKQQQSRNILALFFLLNGLMLGANFLIWNTHIHTNIVMNWHVLPIIVSACMLLQGAALYFYLRSFIEPVKIVSWKNTIHLIPAIITTGVIIAFDIDTHDWVPSNWATISTEKRDAIRFVWFIWKCYPLVYIIACFVTEYRFRRHVKDNYASYSRAEFAISNIVLWGFFIAWAWYFAGYLLGGYLSREENQFMGHARNYINMLFINLVFVFGFINTRQKMREQLVDETPIPEVLSIADDRIKAIERGMNEDKLYLNSHINLERFSEKIGIKPRNVSYILNAHFNSNFFEFINSYRIQEVKRMLVAPECKDETILDMMYKAGFNSQSAFLRFFKRMEGMTPSEYRLRNQSDVVKKQRAL